MSYYVENDKCEDYMSCYDDMDPHYHMRVVYVEAHDYKEVVNDMPIYPDYVESRKRDIMIRMCQIMIKYNKEQKPIKDCDCDDYAKRQRRIQLSETERLEWKLTGRRPGSGPMRI